MPFWLGTLDAFNRYRVTREWTAQDRALSQSMMQTLLAFARTGQPQTAGVVWPRFVTPKPQLVEIADGMSIKDWPDAARLSFFKDFFRSAPKGTN